MYHTDEFEHEDDASSITRQHIMVNDNTGEADVLNVTFRDTVSGE